jgi:hypothetical protein
VKVADGPVVEVARTGRPRNQLDLRPQVLRVTDRNTAAQAWSHDGRRSAPAVDETVCSLFARTSPYRPSSTGTTQHQNRRSHGRTGID